MSDETVNDLVEEHNTEVEEVEGTEPEALNFDAREVERKMIEAAEARAQDPTEVAATAYHMYVPHYKRGVSRLSTRGLRRVLNYLVLYPFEQNDIKAANQLESEMMSLVSNLVEAKIIMIMDQYRLNAEQLYEASQKPLTPEEEAGIQAQIDASEQQNT